MDCHNRTKLGRHAGRPTGEFFIIRGPVNAWNQRSRAVELDFDRTCVNNRQKLVYSRSRG